VLVTLARTAFSFVIVPSTRQKPCNPGPIIAHDSARLFLLHSAGVPLCSLLMLLRHFRLDSGVQVDGEHLQADAVVLALGPWTNTLASSLQLPHISGQLGHSLVLKPSTSEALPADCLFVSWQSKSGVSVRCMTLLNTFLANLDFDGI